MDIRTQAALLAAIVTLALAVAALLRDNRSRVFTLFAVFAADLFLFSLASFFLRWSEAFGVAWWERLAVVSGAPRPRRGARLLPRVPRRGAPPRAPRPEHHARRVALRPRRGRDPARPGEGREAPRRRLRRRRPRRGALGRCGARCTPRRRGSSARGSSTSSSARSSRWSSRRSTCCPRFGLPYPLEGLGSITLTVFMFFLSQTLQRHRLLDLHEFLGKIVVVTALGLVLVGDLRRARVVGGRPARALLLQHRRRLVRDPLALRADAGAGRGVGGRDAVPRALRARAPARDSSAGATANVIEPGRARRRWCSTGSSRRAG